MTTSALGVWTPGDSDDWDLTIDLAAMANSIDTVILNQTNTINRRNIPSVASVAERTTLFPTPVKGNRVFRTDVGWEETYYETGTGGAPVAGWYPTGGAMPFYAASASVSQAATTATITLGAAWGAANTNRKRGFANMTTAGVLTIPFSGWYNIEIGVRLTNSQVVGVFVDDSSSNLILRNNMAQSPSQYAAKKAFLTAGMLIKANAQVAVASGGVVAPNEFDTFFNVTYDGPGMVVG